MKSAQLKRWKENEHAKAKEIVSRIDELNPSKIHQQLYPEFQLSKAYTTSLDPYTPVWSLIPFFDNVIIGNENIHKFCLIERTIMNK